VYERHQYEVIGPFSPFGLAPTGIFPTCLTVDTSERSRIDLFGNVPLVRPAAGRCEPVVH
jgi:hypothetical protein